MSSVACCSGSEHPGKPKGLEETLYGLPTYVTEPSNSSDIKAVLVLIPDAIGWKFNNLRLLADSFAERVGARVLLPDLMNGKAAHVSMLGNMKTFATGASFLTRFVGLGKALYEFIPFRYNNTYGVVWPRVESYFQALRAETKLPIGVTGYCWGGLYTFKIAQGLVKTPDGRPLADAFFTAHPSLFQNQDVELVQLPLLICHGTRDAVVSQTQAERLRNVLAEKNKQYLESKGTKSDDKQTKFELKFVEGGLHGFAVRQSPEDENELKQAQFAEDAAVDWFRRWLKSA